jgi:hypothetical protein
MQVSSIFIGDVPPQRKCAADALDVQGSSLQTGRVADIGWTHTGGHSPRCGVAAKRKYSRQAVARSDSG